jgi:hypothetical protein
MSISTVDPNNQTPEGFSPPRISRPLATRPTPPPGFPQPYHFTEILEEQPGRPGQPSRLDTNTRKKVKRTFEKDSQISILPPGGEALITQITPHLSDITSEGREARSAVGLNSPIRNIGSFQIQLHTSSEDSHKRRKFTVTTPEGDRVSFGQHVQADGKGNIHNSLYPIDGDIQGKPVICTTGKKAQKAWTDYIASPQKKRDLYSRLSDVAYEDKTPLKEPGFMPLPTLP